MFKKIGFSNEFYANFDKTKEMAPELKETYNLILQELGGIFDNINESAGKKTCLFPFAFSEEIEKTNYYNPGSSFKDLVSRMRDTIDNALVDKFLVKDREENTFKFSTDYIHYFKEILADKVDLIYLITWIYRFTPIDVPPNSENSERKITQVLIAKFIQDYNLTHDEINQLFEKKKHEISYSNKPISGVSLRSFLKFKVGMEPEIVTENKKDLNQQEITADEFHQHAYNLQKNLPDDKIMEILNTYKQIIFYGPPGTGKSYVAEQLKKKYFSNNFLVIQFHPNYSYEDFVGGATIADNNLVRVPGIFLKFCLKASKNNDTNYLLIIDEINRGNLANIFGETILALDRDYEVTLPSSYVLDLEDISILKVPKNLYIIATMNTADRSIGHIDYAIRRRFGFVKFTPDPSYLEDVIVDGYPQLSLSKFLEEINIKIVDTLKEPEFVIGHSYLMPKDGGKKLLLSEFKNNFYFLIVPLIEEYTLNNQNALDRIVSSSLISRYHDDEDFVKLVEKQFM